MAGITATTPEEIAHLGQYEEERQSENEKIEEQIEEIMSDEFQFRENLTIDQEFEVLIPKLADSEYEGLKEDIKKHGCRDPVIVWKDHNTIIDGHHRYKICTELGIPYNIEEYEFANRTEVKIWMITNQNARRNLNPSQLGMLAIDLEALYGEKAKERQGIRTDLGQEIDESERGSSAKKAAKVMGISHQTVAYAKRVDQKGVPGLAELVRSGKVAVSAAAEVADESPEIQEKIVDKSRTQIKEGNKPNVCAILREMKSKTADTPEIVPEIADVQEMASETVDLQMKDGSVSDSTIEEKEKPSDNQERSQGTEITNLPINVPEELKEEWVAFNEYLDFCKFPLEGRDALWEDKLKKDQERKNGSSCNPWYGPWICHHCKVEWEQWAIDHPPKHCPGCDEVDGIRRWSIEDLGPEFMKGLMNPKD